MMRSNSRSTTLIFLIVFLDAMGIGIVFPVLPGLLRSLLHGQGLHGPGDVVRQYGYLLAAYAATMLLASPVLGALSDRFGRRPILLLSLMGTAVDDLVMALSPTVWVLYVGRAVAGLTGANMTVANAYLADINSAETRAAAFGRMNAFFGVGFIAGPVLGGLCGTYSLRAPFYVAAGLNLIGFLVCALVLPESLVARAAVRPRITLAQLNPFAAMRAISGLHGVGRLLYMFCTIDLVGQVPAVLWVLYTTGRFQWTPTVVGISFAYFGLFHALCQAFLPERLQKRWGERGTLMIGMTADSVGMVLFSLARSTAAVFGMIPLLCLGGVSLPALQSLLSNSVGDERQGEMQGVLTSFNGLIAVTGPVLASGVYGLLRERVPSYPGAVWLVPVMLYLPCFLMVAVGGKLGRRASVTTDGE
ncbi:TCR/Tet family MFS transporter [Granulicella tundricola]|uniref:Major facilitator superfamily MFS_1 n=1 Tax=Granulicella tundricola (strain ATCC BAA-1859 / DSM 23138 / MP5ACTX9) TaxID=1198114 RepID=E8WX57_GRATM|nr:TCR/Tet family MFS transporter [Granulicella tundricola]ADW69699.1 major facilitator superfamily MFS_1 [Granulicella tundricola MP5ACTX9]